MSAGALENEVKIAVPDAGNARELLSANRFIEVKPRIFEANTLFDNSANDIRNSGRTVRIRTVGDEALLTFKGPADRTRHKIREEIETHVTKPEALAAILERLDYQPKFRYEKYRTEFGRPGESGLVTLDETPIGCYLELEGSPGWIDATAHELGFSESDYITNSYATLYTRYCRERGLEPAHMTFSDARSHDLQ